MLGLVFLDEDADGVGQLRHRVLLVFPDLIEDVTSDVEDREFPNLVYRPEHSLEFSKGTKFCSGHDGVPYSQRLHRLLVPGCE